MTAVEWLIKQIKSDQNQKALSSNEWMYVIEQAKEMEKQQIIDAANLKKEDRWFDAKLYNNCGEKYFAETYGSKGIDDINPLTSNHVDYQNHSNMSDNFKQFSLYEHKETITSADIKKAETMGLYDKIELVNPNDSIFSQKEISDEEIEAFAMGYYDNNGAEYYVRLGAKWYREQLKSKQ